MNSLPESLLNRIDTISACLHELLEKPNLSYAVIKERVQLLRVEIERNPDKDDYMKACSMEVDNAESLLKDTMKSERTRLRKRGNLYKIGFLLFALVVLLLGVVGYLKFSLLIAGVFLAFGLVGAAGLSLDLKRISKQLKKQVAVRKLHPFLGN